MSRSCDRIKGNYEEGVDAYNKFIIGKFWNDFLKAVLKLKYYMSSVTREVDKIEYTGCLFRLL